MQPYSITIISMFLSGILGGTVNFLDSRENNYQISNYESEKLNPQIKNNRGFLIWLKFFLLGTIAAFLIPVFLATISSDLLSKILLTKEDLFSNPNIYIFFGFCLLASISSKKFIQTISDKILKIAKEANDKSTDAIAKTDSLAETIDPLLQKGTEPEEKEDELSRSLIGKLSPYETKILNAIKKSKFILRTLSGISQQIKLTPEETLRNLDSLTKQGYLSQIERSNGKRWAITAKGQQLLK